MNLVIVGSSPEVGALCRFISDQVIPLPSSIPHINDGQTALVCNRGRTFAITVGKYEKPQSA